MHDAAEHADLKATAIAGGAWYQAPDEVAAGRVDITIALALFGDESLTTYDVSFEWNGENDFATFVLGVAEGETQAPGAYSPVYGWIAWNDDAIDFAYQWPELDRQDARDVGGSPLAAVGSPSDGDPEPWAVMAKHLVEVSLGDR